ncbi:alpha-beta hydrolase superfamily lysophospholipase [Couchioplanes caeruleus]|uniref:Alpha-beta hydrolase superfamily lysophospholipase n=1 Tax=Couchioplanes caeruleus TaxID=56438 RepID=A0A3N1GDT6_9ACTN|nr:alpha-beta hydrolase superfamily lysophospholipase [Couchioplanes caeruleus]
MVTGAQDGGIVDYHDGAYGRVRSRTFGRPHPGVPEIVMVHGMAVCDYLLPGLAELARWTRVHLIDLPGCGGSGEPPHELSLGQYADAVLDWLDACPHRGVLLAGQSSGTQVVAEAAAREPGDVVGVVLVCPTLDPVLRRPLPLLRRWRMNQRREAAGLNEVHRPDRRRVNLRRKAHLLLIHLRHRIEAPIAALRMPVLILCGSDDTLSPPSWGRRLAALAAHGEYAQVPGPHTFCWSDPAAWSPPIAAFAARNDLQSAS